KRLRGLGEAAQIDNRNQRAQQFGGNISHVHSPRRAVPAAPIPQPFGSPRSSLFFQITPPAKSSELVVSARNRAPASNVSLYIRGSNIHMQLLAYLARKPGLAWRNNSLACCGMLSSEPC